MKSEKYTTLGKVVFWMIILLWVLKSTVPCHAQPPEGMTEIPAGEFIMGLSENDIKDITRNIGGQKAELQSALPQHKVRLSPFYIDKLEVTNKEYKKFIEATGHQPPEEGWEDGSPPKRKESHPVTFVTFNDAEAYCKWAGKRLPTEAEWERAARGTDGRYFPWGNKYKRKSYANTNKSRNRGTTKVGSFKKGASPDGCYDMAGNVWEWTSSYYLPYPNSPHKDEFYGKERRVLRGGSWDDPVNYAITAIRIKVTPNSSDELSGFRCAMDAGAGVETTKAKAVSPEPIEISPKPAERSRPAKSRRRTNPAAKASAKSAGSTSSDMVLVAGGEFQMGLDEKDLPAIVDDLGGMVKYHFNATPKHTVNLAAFFIDKTEVTNEEYKKFVDATSHQPPEEGWEDGKYPKRAGKKPVVFINWNDAKAFCEWKGKRLPTEAEWEKAARGADGRLFPWGNKFQRKNAITNKARKRSPIDVGKTSRGKSPFGCFDMAGNVWEWTSSYYLPYPGNNHEDEFYGNARYVIRGGSFLDFPYDALTTVRSKFTPVTTDENVGFRCAKTP